MSDFMNLFKRHLKMQFRPRNAIILSVLFVLCIGFILYGIVEYKHIMKAKDDFKDFEKEKVKQYVTVTQYGTYGTRIFFYPAPVSILFINTCGLPDIQSFVDSGERLKAYNSIQGQNLFKLKVKKIGVTDFSGVFLFLFGLAFLFYGYEAPRNRKYLKELITLYPDLKVYVSLWLPRAVFLIGVYLALIACVVLLFLLSGVPFPFHGQVLVYLFMGLLALLFFLSLGFFLGMIKKSLLGIPLIFACWLALVYLIPALVDLSTAWKANNIIPIYKMEMEKLKIIMKVEKEAIEKAGTFNYGKNVTEEDKRLITEYYNNDFKRINEMEDKLRAQMEESIRWHHLLSSIFPSTSYLAISDEFSSMGARSIVELMGYSLDLKKDFFKYYMEKLYFSGEQGNFGPVENFIKNEENIFYAKSRLPYYWGLHIGLAVLYILALLSIGFMRFKKYLFLQPENWETGANNREYQLKKGRAYPFHVKDKRFTNQVYSLLSGKNRDFKKEGFKEFSIDGADLVPQSYSCSFFYLCRLEDHPEGMTAEDLLLITLPAASTRSGDFMLPEYAHKKLRRLTPAEKEDIYIKILTGIKREIYLIDDIGKHLNVSIVRRLKQQMTQLAEQGALVIYLLTDFFPVVEYSLTEETALEHDRWSGMIDSFPPEIEEIFKKKKEEIMRDAIGKKK